MLRFKLSSAFVSSWHSLAASADKRWVSSLAFLTECFNFIILTHVSHGHLFELFSLNSFDRLATEFQNLKSNSFVVEFIFFNLVWINWNALINFALLSVGRVMLSTYDSKLSVESNLTHFPLLVTLVVVSKSLLRVTVHIRHFKYLSVEVLFLSGELQG